MKFKIIPNEQTPEIRQWKTAHDLIAEDKKLLEKFLSFAMRQKNCTGLAANQVSVNGKRIMERFFALKDRNGWELIIGPTITKKEGNPRDEIEGCLTWLGKKLKVKRYFSIKVSYYNLRGEYIETELIDFKAQVFQHEYDHLNGVEEIFV